MTDWIEQYSAALDIRDAREQAHKQYIDAYTKLADRTAAANTTSPSLPILPPSRTSTPTKPQPPSSPDSTLRADLASTQKARATLQTQLSTLQTTLQTLQTTYNSTLASNALLLRRKTEVERKLRDREEEMRTKAKLVTDAQDEMVALQLQLNLAEERSEKLERENKELVDRWMKRMGEEAERVNRDSRWE